MNREDLERKLKSLKALADRGVDGEAENAQALLDRLMKKYGIVEEDFMNEKKFEFFHSEDGEFSYKLLIQIAAKHFPEVGVIKLRDRRDDFGNRMKRYVRAKFHLNWCPDIYIEATKADYLGLMSMYDIYWYSLQQHKDTFYISFLYKNDLLVSPKEGDNKEPSEEELRKYQKALRMAGGIDSIDPKALQIQGMKQLPEHVG